MPNPSFTLTEIQQLQAEGLVLRYPDVLMNAQVTLEGSVSLLLRAAQQAMTVPFVWSWIDRALADGQTFIVFLPSHTPFPIDGIRWPESENKYSINQGTPKELEVCEAKFGFVPGSGETMAARIRRRYRLVHGGGMGGMGAMPQLWVVHYTRGPNGPPIPPAIANQPARMYPLRQVNEPPMFVAGEKLGQKVFPGQGGMSGGMPSGSAGMGMGMGMGAFNQQQAQALIAQQNSNMEMLEARRTHSLAPPGRRPVGAPGGQGSPDDDDSGDEIDSISTRTHALMRYKRNHDLMNEVFVKASFGDSKPPTSPYAIFDKKELDEKAVSLFTFHSPSSFIFLNLDPVFHLSSHFFFSISRVSSCSKFRSQSHRQDFPPKSQLYKLVQRKRFERRSNEKTQTVSMAI
ncbi:hypothetical protein EV359DRAFT_31371 [Lentinula novae-zelandiae]|nr:hypothetical protein EV359DRAFT_31371 [Lentinula novae-zelandiae]